MADLRLRCLGPACLWCRTLLGGRPDLDVTVRSVVPLEDGTCLEEVEIRGDVPDDLVENLTSLDSVNRIETLDSQPDRLVVRIVGDGCGLAEATRETGVAPSVPFPVERDGDAWSVTAPPDRIESFLEALEDRQVEVETVYAGPDRDDGRSLLTERQQEILDAAVEHGFYDYPREITLTELADELGVVKSTLSEALVMIETKVFRRLAATGRVDLDGRDDRPD